jgi:hypothetical protein
MIDLTKHGRELLKLHAMIHGDGAKVYDLLGGLPGHVQDLAHACEGREVATSLEEIWAATMEYAIMVAALKGIGMEQALADSLHTIRAISRDVRRSRREGLGHGGD